MSPTLHLPASRSRPQTLSPFATPPLASRLASRGATPHVPLVPLSPSSLSPTSPTPLCPSNWERHSNVAASPAHHQPPWPPPVLLSTGSRPGTAIYDPSLMEPATLGPWRRTVDQVNFMAHCMEEEKVAASPSSSSSSSGVDEKGRNDENDPSLWHPFGDRLVGMHKWYPEVYHWIATRMGTRTKVCLITSFIVFEALKFLLAEHAYAEGVNTLSILVVTNFSSLILALWVSFVLEGGVVINKIVVWHPLVRFVGISCLFTFASVLILLAYRLGTPAAEVVTVGYIYMPISVVLSYFVFRRRYGTLEFLSVGMMTLAILCFVLLREQSKGDLGGSRNFVIPGFGLVVGAVAVSVMASILAERVFKDRSAGLIRLQSRKQDKFYIMKVHLDFSSLLVSVGLWCARTRVPHMFGDFFEQWSHSRDWFGTWGRYQFLMVFVAVGQGWAAGLVTKEFSTVIKAIVQTLSVVLVMLLGDPLMGNRFHFQAREMPSIILTVIIVMCAVIFQTGRINLKVLRKAANLGPEAHPNLEMAALAAPEDGGSPSPIKQRYAMPLVSQRLRHSARQAAKDMGDKEGSEDDEESERSAAPLLRDTSSGEEVTPQWRSCMSILTTYALIVVYIVSDAGRTLVLQRAMQKTAINSASMGLVCYVCGAIVASGLSLYTHGFSEGLLRAWSPRKILHCLPAAFLFALATAMANMSFAQGITSALYMVLGKFYTPVAAIGARWIMGKFYMWLEWLALLILTLASVVFGYLQAFNVATGVPSGAPLLAMLLVLGSAASSAFASLVTEKILKGETSPFHLQKVRLDAGSIISTIALLPVLGVTATRAQDVPWVERPSDATCPVDSVCWDLRNHTCANVACTCECTSGVFAGWNSVDLFLAVAINTAQGWLVGKVTHRFSVVHRAIADSFSLLAIYFIGDPLVNGTSLSNVSLNLVAFIVPLSTATFAVATSEMEKVFFAKSRLDGLRDHAGNGAFNSDADTESDESDISELNLRGFSEGRAEKRPKSAC